MNTIAQIIDAHWIAVKDGDPRVSSIYKRHYSCYQYADKRRSLPGYRNRHLVMGPGERLVLLSADCRAIFGWRKFRDGSGQTGITCAFFRNEGAFAATVLSSTLILAAEELALIKWPDAERFYTYINTKVVQGDGRCFKAAGWQKCGKTKSGLLILEKLK